MVCSGATDSIARRTSPDASNRPSRTSGGGRIASASVSMPQSPHPVGPARCRRRASRPAARGSASHIRNSMPDSCSTISSRSISSMAEAIPSVRLKPRAKSSRSCGVAIITA
jgi:hypothetical protein